MATEASTLKTKVDTNLVKKLLCEEYRLQDIDLVPVTHGESSQAFYFTANTTAYVIRVHTQNHGFEKDQYASKHFVSTDVPIPQIEKIGQLSDTLHYAISKRATGDILDVLEKN